MKRHVHRLLSGLIHGVVGAGLLYWWFPGAAQPDHRTFPGPALRDDRTPSPAPPSASSTEPGPNWNAPRGTGQVVPKSTPSLPAAPPAWTEAKARVERIRIRYHDAQRQAAVPRYRPLREERLLREERPLREERLLREERQKSGSAEARGAVIDGVATDATAELPPVIVPFDPQHPSLPAPLPAVLADFPEGGGITPEQQDGINQLAEDFLRAVADSPADPTDPAYQKRWQQAQLTADQLFRLRYGDFAWMLRQHAAYRQALGGHTGK